MNMTPTCSGGFVEIVWGLDLCALLEKAAEPLSLSVSYGYVCMLVTEAPENQRSVCQFMCVCALCLVYFMYMYVNKRVELAQRGIAL